MSDTYNIDGNIVKNINNLISKLNKNIELEASINHKQKITRDNYNNIIRYLINRSKHDKKEDKLQENDILDIAYMYSRENMNVYRISINGIDNINNIMSKVDLRNNTSIFAILANNYKSDLDNGKTPSMEIIHKIKDQSDYIDIVDYDIRIRMAQELQLKEDEYAKLLNIPLTEQKHIIYRLKHRITYEISFGEYNILIDLTNVETSNRFSGNKYQTYELEVEVVALKQVKKEDIKTIYNKLLEEIYLLQNLIQKSEIILNASDKYKVLNMIKDILYDKTEKTRGDLPIMQSESLSAIHIQMLGINYSVTDKADGERAFLIILDNNLYIINNNLHIKKIDVSVEEAKLVAYNRTIIDGEYVYIEKYNNFVFLGFDILYYKNTDVRQIAELSQRLDKLNDVMTNIFKVKTSHDKYIKSEKIEDIIKYYSGNIRNYFKEMNDKLKAGKTVIINKLFFIPLGIYKSELFAYSKLIWDLYTNVDINCPYMLDGLVYTGLNQKYTKIAHETKFKIYKWKPPHMNTIDFYIKFERDQDTGKILNVFDNASGKLLDEKLENTEINDIDLDNELEKYKAENHVYRIVKLYVGSTKTGVEQPVLFKENLINKDSDLKKDNLYYAHFFLDDGEVRDELGNKIEDNMVIECSYSNDVMKEYPYRWNILRIRTDKTESVRLHKRKYGNNENVANNIWASIHNAIELKDIDLLANEKTHIDHLNKIMNSITFEDIGAQRRSDAYYQMTNKLMEDMRQYHNFNKSNHMYKYCGARMSIDGKYHKQDILDIGIGRGGDIGKYNTSRINSLVGVDIDSAGLFTLDDGVMSRYNKFKRKFQHLMFPITLIVGDGSGKLDLESQIRLIPAMTEKNKESIVSVFGENGQSKKHLTFDIINMQFSVHFMFRNDDTLNSCCENFKKYLKHGGIVLISTIDGNLLNEILQKEPIFSRSYTTDTGEKRILFEYKKLYNETNIAKTGLAVDFHNASFNEIGTYNTEYIVDPKFMIEQFKKKAGLALIETDTFENQYKIHKHFLQEIAPYEANEKTNKYFKRVIEFYNQNDEINKNSFDFTKLHRYYVFQKI